MRELSLRDFRNYRQQHLQLAPGLNVFVGNNGQGKTNLMEAVHVLLQLRSFRSHYWKQLVRKGALRASVEGVLENKLGTDAVRLEISAAGRKAWWNENVVRKMSAHVRRSFAVLFNPEQLYQHRYHPGERRALLDGCLSFTDAGYGRHLADFSQARRQKNQLLKEHQSQGLEVWDTLLIKHGRKLVIKRHLLVEQLNPILNQLYAAIAPVLALSESTPEKITSSAANLELRYLPNMDGDEPSWRERMAQMTEQEHRIGHVLVGPHRDNIQMWRHCRMNGTIESEPESMLSQGEYRLALLTLKLALNKLLQDDAVLILDDFFSELDGTTKQRLCEYLNQVPNQIFITTTDADSLKGLTNAHWMEIENGATRASLHH